MSKRSRRRPKTDPERLQDEKGAGSSLGVAVHDADDCAVRAERSLVRVWRGPRQWGLNVVAAEKYILTAARCLPALPAMGLRSRKSVLVKVCSFRPRKMRVAVVAGADPCLDIAMLSSSTLRDGELDRRQKEALREFFDARDSVPLYLGKLRAGWTVTLHVCTHKGKWLPGSATVHAPLNPFLDVFLEDKSPRIGPETSGSPAFDDDGRVVGIVSTAAVGSAHVHVVCVTTALPGWFLQTAREMQSY